MSGEASESPPAEPRCDRCESGDAEPDSAFCWICALDYEEEQAEMRAKDAGESLW